MLWEDIVYVAVLLSCVAVGFLYRNIADPNLKQWTSTIIGFTVATVVSGSHVLHPLISCLINAIIITRLSPKKCHLASFYFSFFYLLVVFRLGDFVGLPTPPNHTNLIVMILTLKLSGLAFEVNAATNVPDDDPNGENSEALRSIGFLDVFHYGFGYMGLLTGPYYRYRTYWDHLHRPFAEAVDPRPLTFYKLKQIGCFVVLFVIMNMLYPSQYIVTEEFAERSFLYRHLYMYPTFATFRLRMYIGMILAECACQMAGLGAYPVKCSPVKGLGPKDYKIVKALSATPEKLKDEEYNFDTVYNMNVGRLEKCTSTRTAMKAWNGCAQYWFGVYVYKKCPYKSLRTHVTFLLSALWHGYAVGYYVCICQIPLFLMVEDICIKFHDNSKENSIAKHGWWLLLWYLKTTCMAYLGVPFLLRGFGEIIHYYKVVYLSGHFVVIGLYIMALYLKPYLLKNTKENKEKRSKDE